ncbi:MAG: cysteine desulfurase CsdA [Rhodospirillaceae bacterium]|nr:cysteine desulfurase CsdA [Rhodospirillaceae bacterium]
MRSHNTYRNDFPIFNQDSNSRLVFLDSAASSQKPLSVIESMNKCYKSDYANIHRGLYDLSENLTNKYEGVRKKIANFINASNEKEVVFTRGATEGINLVANSWGMENINEGDEILLSSLEHHSNIVPWQMVAKNRGAKIKVIPINNNGDLELSAIDNLLNKKTKIVAITQASNAIGTIPDLRPIIDKARKNNSKVLIDGCQAIVHMQVDVNDLDCDFYVFSGHKMYGPSGIGVLYTKEEILEKMNPYQGGGEMIDQVSFESTTYAPIPIKFEAGTPNIVGTIGLGSAIDYIEKIGYNNILEHENILYSYAYEKFSQNNNIEIYGKSKLKTSLISFILKGIHPHDTGMFLNSMGIAVRVGHHCAQPLMNFFRISGTVRASFAIYNTIEDIDCLYDGVCSIIKRYNA